MNPTLDTAFFDRVYSDLDVSDVPFRYVAGIDTGEHFLMEPDQIIAFLCFHQRSPKKAKDPLLFLDQAQIEEDIRDAVAAIADEVETLLNR